VATALGVVFLIRCQVNINIVKFYSCLRFLAVFALIGCASTTPPPPQELPCWQKEACLAATYPESQWYFGFAEGNSDISRNALEQQARGKMVEKIRVDVSSRSSVETRSKMVSGSEEISRDFASATQISADAEVVNSFSDSYYDTKAGKVHAFAAVRKVDLASYYARKVESALSEARHSLELAGQMAKSDRKKDAIEKLEVGKKHIESCARYRSLLLAVDGHSYDEQANELLKSIAALQIELEKAAVVFVTGTESIVPRLQTLISESKITVTEKEEEASYILNIDAKVCNAKQDEHFHYANGCIKVVLTNVRTGANEITITVNGRKEGGLNENDAGERAFKSAVVELWSKIKDKIMEINL